MNISRSSNGHCSSLSVAFTRHIRFEGDAGMGQHMAINGQQNVAETSRTTQNTIPPTQNSQQQAKT